MSDLVNLFRAAGIVAWPLLVSSIVAVALIAERLVFWFRVTRGQRRVVQLVLSIYRENPYAAVDKLQKNVDLPLSQIFLEALALDEPNPEEFRLALVECRSG